MGKSVVGFVSENSLVRLLGCLSFHHLLAHIAKVQPGVNVALIYFHRLLVMDSRISQIVLVRVSHGNVEVALGGRLELQRTLVMINRLIILLHHEQSVAQVVVSMCLVMVELECLGVSLDSFFVALHLAEGIAEVVARLWLAWVKLNGGLIVADGLVKLLGQEQGICHVVVDILESRVNTQSFTVARDGVLWFANVVVAVAKANVCLQFVRAES